MSRNIESSMKWPETKNGGLTTTNSEMYPVREVQRYKKVGLMIRGYKQDPELI